MTFENKELREDIEYLKNFANINSNSDIGKKLHVILDKLGEFLNKEEKTVPPPIKENYSTLSFGGVIKG